MAKTYGVGIMGAGNISAAYLRLAPLFKNLEVRAISDVLPEAAKKRADEYNVAAQTPDELLKKLRTSLLPVLAASLEEHLARLELEAGASRERVGSAGGQGERRQQSESYPPPEDPAHVRILVKRRPAGCRRR